MSRILISTLLGLFIIVNSGCRQNRMKTNQKELENEILAQDNSKKQVASTTDNTPDATERYNGIFRKKEIRSIDKQRPLIKIDVIGTANDKREIKLSDIATSIRYVKLETPTDTSLLYDPFFNRENLLSIIQSDGEQIIFQGIFGLSRFNMNGDYIQTIWRNETGITFEGNFVMYGRRDFYGVLPNIPVSLLNGNIYYTFLDGPKGNKQVIKYKPENSGKLAIQSKPEIPGLGTIFGDTLFNAQQNSTEGYNWIYGLGNGIWAGINQKCVAGETGSLLVTYNDKGDTICQFTDFDRIKNFSSNVYRTPVELASYYYKGQLTIKQEYNDTIFRLISPDRLLPVYLIDFGSFKVSYNDGLNPEIDLSNKFLLYSLYESDDFLFVRYTQNNSSINNIKKNAVKFYNAIFIKKEGKLIHLPEVSNTPRGLINDLDGGIPFWPDFITPQGELIDLVTGKLLKNYINSSEFKNLEISQEARQKQISLANGLRPTDMILIFVK
jgi:Domain of unknown function (DUF4933)